MRGRDTYLAFLIPVDDPGVVAHLHSIVRSIEHLPGVEPYPESYWHLTVKGIGFEGENSTQPDGVSRQAFGRIADAARRIFESQVAFEVTIGPPSGFPEVVFAEVWDSLVVRELNGRLLEMIPGLMRYPFDGEAFLPHVSIARFASAEGLAELKQTLASIRDDGPGPGFNVREVQLVRAHLSSAAPRLEPIETYPLRR
jgi:2'-5' RNA ligase